MRAGAHYDVTAFGALAEHAATTLSQVDRVVVTGSSEVRDDQAKNGSTQKATGILADALGPDLRWVTVTLARWCPYDDRGQGPPVP